MDGRARADTMEGHSHLLSMAALPVLRLTLSAAVPHCLAPCTPIGRLQSATCCTWHVVLTSRKNHLPGRIARSHAPSLGACSDAQGGVRAPTADDAHPFAPLHITPLLSPMPMLGRSPLPRPVSPGAVALECSRPTGGPARDQWHPHACSVLTLLVMPSLGACAPSLSAVQGPILRTRSLLLGVLPANDGLPEQLG